MAQKDDEARGALYEIQIRWRIVALEKRLRELDEEALKHWHWLEVTIEKFKIKQNDL